MRYRPTVNIWQESPATLQRGQWVSAGPPEADRSNCGQFYGVRASGAVVVAWNGNARNAENYREYHRITHAYGTAEQFPIPSHLTDRLQRVSIEG